MKSLREEDRRQLEQFLSTLFLPDEWIELRFIESWTSRGKKRSRVIRPAEWLPAAEFVSQHLAISDFAARERANVYFGVCPRPKKGDSQDDQIQTVRCLWCDIDDVTVQDACQRWNRARVPRPSLVVSSGSGIHGYWLLDRDVRSQRGRSLITAMLPHFYRSFGGDHVQNLSRILRPPGTVNCKDARNGRFPRPCTLLTCRPEVRYSLEAFSEWTEQAQKQPQRRIPSGSANSRPEVSPEAVLARNTEVGAIVRQLGQPSRDRSRRDFAIVCDLIRLGLTQEEIWPLVCGRSKFESNGRPYFERTIANAATSIAAEEIAASQSRAPT